MPISFLLTTIVCLFIGNTVSQFSKYMPSSGGYYSFATRGPGQPQRVHGDLELPDLRHHRPGRARSGSSAT